MAVCKRCGKVFNYEKRDGVCPKCCFYNRPEGTWQEDDSWIKNYNYEDNSYDVKAHEYESEDGREKIFGRDGNDVGANWKDAFERNKHQEVSGSHKHTEDGRILKGSSATTKKSRNNSSKSKKSGKSGKKMGCGTIFIIIFWIYLIFGLLASFFNW